MATDFVAAENMRLLQTAVCEALGLKPETVRGIDIHLAVHDVATMTVDYYLTTEQAARYAAVLETFALHPISLSSEVVDREYGE